MNKQTLYTCRVDKNGKETWYRDCRLAQRLIRVSADKAKLDLATGQGRRV